MDEWLSPPCSLPSVTIKTHWINTEAGTAISTIHSQSRLLSLTFTINCPTDLFALKFPLTFNLSKCFIDLFSWLPPHRWCVSQDKYKKDSSGLCFLSILSIYSIKITAVLICNINSLFFSVSIHLLGTVSESVYSKPMTISHWLGD